MLAYAVDLTSATHPNEDATEDVKRYVQYGSGPRGLQSLIRLAKARALVAGRYHVSIADIKSVAKPVLRHRMLLNYEGEAEGKTADSIIDSLLQSVKQGQPS
jgi:MoxR-like ATPase